MLTCVAMSRVDLHIFNSPPSLFGCRNFSSTAVRTGGDHKRQKIRSFELFRRSSLDTEIITFDELYAKTSFIVEQWDCDRKTNGT